MNTKSTAEEATGVTTEHTPMEGISVEKTGKGKAIQSTVEESSSDDDDDVREEVPEVVSPPTNHHSQRDLTNKNGI